MGEKEQRFLEQVAELIPGVKGYRDKEARRDTDKRLRESLGRRIDAARESLQGAKRKLLDAGQLKALGSIDRVERKLQRAADSLRFASYGYSGFFGKDRVEEPELDRIYEYDRGLVVAVDELADHCERVSGSGEVEAGLDPLEALVDRLLGDVDRRKQVLEPAD